MTRHQGEPVWERADLSIERAALAGDLELRDALRRGQAGAFCAECKIRMATTVVRRRILMCRTCADVDTACRRMDAVALRLQRRSR
jgi:hypothetical protein